MSNSTIIYSAPLSICLSGEDAALYGKPVLIAATNLLITLSLTEDTKQSPDKLSDLVKKKVVEYLKKHSVSFKEKPFKYTLKSDVTFKYDTLFQSAKIVVLVAALLEFHTGKQFEHSQINTLAYICEKEYFHYSLGFYTSCSTFGGLQYFRKEFEFLKSISQLNFKLADIIQKKLFIVDTGEENTTPLTSISAVKKIYNADSEKIENIFSNLEKVTKRLVVAIAKEDALLFKKSIEHAQLELEKITEVSGKLKEFIKEMHTAKLIGFKGKKRTGGLILVYTENETKLKKAVQKRLFKYYPFTLSIEGLTRK